MELEQSFAHARQDLGFRAPFSNIQPRNLPERMSGGFEDLGLMPELVRATQELGWL